MLWGKTLPLGFGENAEEERESRSNIQRSTSNLKFYPFNVGRSHSLIFIIQSPEGVLPQSPVRRAGFRTAESSRGPKV
jgi:hypothetical protein